MLRSADGHDASSKLIYQCNQQVHQFFLQYRPMQLADRKRQKKRQSRDSGWQDQQGPFGSQACNLHAGHSSNVTFSPRIGTQSSPDATPGHGLEQDISNVAVVAGPPRDVRSDVSFRDRNWDWRRCVSRTCVPEAWLARVMSGIVKVYRNSAWLLVYYIQL